MNSSYRENSLSAGDSLRSHHPSTREGLSPVPSPASHPTAAPTTVPLTQAPAPSRQHRCISQSLQADLGPGWRSTGAAEQGVLHQGRSSSHGGAELSDAGRHSANQSTAVCAPCFHPVSTNHGWWFAATLCPEHKWSQSLHLPPSPPYSPWSHPRRGRRAILQQCFHHQGAAGAKPTPSTPPASCGLPGQPPALDTRLLPRQGRAAAARAAGTGAGGRRGFLLLPRLPEN